MRSPVGAVRGRHSARAPLLYSPSCEMASCIADAEPGCARDALGATVPRASPVVECDSVTTPVCAARAAEQQMDRPEAEAEVEKESGEEETVAADDEVKESAEKDAIGVVAAARCCAAAARVNRARSGMAAAVANRLATPCTRCMSAWPLLL